MVSRRAVRATVAATLSVAVASLYALQVREADLRAARRVGISIDQGEHGVLVLDVEAGLPAARAGIEKGDEIVAIGDVPLGKVIDYDVAAARLHRGEAMPYALLRDGRRLSVGVVPGVPFPYVQFSLDTLDLFGYLALALLALFQGTGDLRARLLFVFATAVTLELALPYEAIGEPALMVFSLSLYYLLTGLEMATELHLASVIPQRYGWIERRRWLVPGYYVVGLGLGSVTAATYLTEGVLGQPHLLPWTAVQAEGLLLNIGLPLWALGVPAILALQVSRATEARARHQAGLVLAGVLPWTVTALLATAFDLQGWQIPWSLTAVETLALLAYPVAVFIAIYRYRLFDMELVVRRGLVYTTLTGALILVFYAALGAGGAIFSNLVEGGSSVWFISAVTLALGLLFAPLRRFLQGLIDRRFFPERRALRQRLVALAGELPGLGKLPLMGEHLVGRLEKIFAVRSASLLLTEPKSGLLVPLASTRPPDGEGGPTFLVGREDAGVVAMRRAGRPLSLAQLREKGGNLAQRLGQLEATVAVPLLVQSDLIGILVLGPRQAGDRFPAEELDLLNLLGHHVATVFQNARLFESATYESLTGLPRREAILEVLARELERAERYGRPLTVGMADLDHFKEVNDRYGHLAGDGLLKHVAQVLAGGLRSTDAVGRYGGEEFLLVLPETDLGGARVVADKLRRLVEDVREPMDDGSEASVTVSIGLASLGTKGSGTLTSARELLKLADQALYRAKEEGRNRIHPPFIARVS